MRLVQYNSQALFVGPEDALSEHTTSNIKQLRGIQDITFDINRPIVDIEGVEGSFDRIKLQSPRVNLSFDYFVYDGQNEEKLGFNTNGTGSAVWAFKNYERNFFLITRNNRDDYNLYSGFDNTVLGFGQGALNSFGVQGSVGRPLTSNVSLEFLNMNVVFGSSGVQLPIVDKVGGGTIITSGQDVYFYTGDGSTSGDAAYAADLFSHLYTGSGTEIDWESSLLSFLFTGDGSTTDFTYINANYTVPFADITLPAQALRPGDISLQIPESATFAVLTSGESGMSVQNFDVQIAFVRQDDLPMGYMYPRTRPIDPPIELRLSVAAIVERHKQDSLNDLFCSGGSTVIIDVNKPCSTRAIRYRFDKLYLESVAVSESIENAQSVTFNWSSRIFNYTTTGSNYANFTITTGS